MKKDFIWGLAEKAEWYEWWPRGFWLWLLKRKDMQHGYDLEYDE